MMMILIYSQIWISYLDPNAQGHTNVVFFLEDAVDKGHCIQKEFLY